MSQRQYAGKSGAKWAFAAGQYFRMNFVVNQKFMKSYILRLRKKIWTSRID